VPHHDDRTRLEEISIRLTAGHKAYYSVPVRSLSPVPHRVLDSRFSTTALRGSSSEGIRMGTQALQLDTSEITATKKVRSKKVVALVSGGAILVILVAMGVYYVAFRSLPTTVSWAPSVSAIAPGGDLTVSGRVTPTESGRQISFETAPTAQGPWQPMPQSATTDSRGRFSITYKPQFTGSIVMRVVVDPAGRYLAVTGQSNPVRLLSLSSIALTGGGTVPTQTPLNFTVTVDPPRAGRTLRIEQSSDKVRWVPVGPTAQTKADGTSVAKVPSPAVGVWFYRATVAQDDEFAAAVSPVVGATVKDVAPLQARGDKYFAATDYKNAAAWDQKVLDVDPNNEVALLALGAAQFNLGHGDEAKKHWLVAAALYPQNAEVHYDLGFLYLNQTPPDKAKMTAEWKRVAEIDPNSELAKKVASQLKKG
jgi:hypothetical protein